METLSFEKYHKAQDINSQQPVSIELQGSYPPLCQCLTSGSGGGTERHYNKPTPVTGEEVPCFLQYVRYPAFVLQV